MDTRVGLYNGSGTRLAENDDSSASIGGGGSVHGYDSYIQYTVTADGTYYAAVSAYNNYGSSGPVFSNNGYYYYSNGDYVLNVSVKETSSATSSFNYTVSDGRGGTDVESVTVRTVAGTNLVGTGASETLIGAETSDTLTGGGGGDFLVGGGGSDRFDYNGISEGTDTITDFTRGASGDALDIRDILVGYSPATSNINDFVQLAVSGGNTTMLVDANGAAGGASFTALATLQGVTGLLLNDLLANDNLIVS